MFHGCGEKGKRQMRSYSAGVAVDLGRLDDLNWEMRELPLYRIALVLEKKDEYFHLRAIGTTCTHQTCSLRAAADGFFCPCHGSQFSTRGEVLTGPAEKNLPYFKLDYQHGRLSFYPALQVKAEEYLSVAVNGKFGEWKTTQDNAAHS